VFNFDAPWHPDDYVHRIGRTGRAGATGTAYTFVTKDDEEAIAQIEKLTKHKIERIGKTAPATEEKAETNSKSTPREKAPREPRLAREARPAREPRAEREARPERAPRTAKPIEDRPEVDQGDDDWNGPVPSFLNFGLGS
jgi:superfamily II DNA/RNA helicase